MNLSIKSRIGIWTVVTVVIVISLMSVIAYKIIGKSLLRNLRYSLDVNTQMFFEEFLDDEPAEAIEEIKIFLQGFRSFGKMNYAIWFDDEPALLQSDLFEEWGDLENDLIKESLLDSDIHFKDYTFEETNYLLSYGRFPNPRGTSDKHLNIVLAGSKEHIEEELEEIFELLITCDVIIAFVFVIVTLVIIQWGMKPVAQLTEKMRNVTGDNIYSIRPEMSKSPSELRPFVGAWNQMLKRLSRSMKQQARFTADASHELRTPLAILKSTLQVARSKKRDQGFYEESIDLALDDIERLEEIVTQLLELSRLDNIEDASASEIVNIEELLLDLTLDYEKIASERDIKIQTDLVSNFVCANNNLLRRMFGNVINNAIKYGPTNSEVKISNVIKDDHVVITVHDQGGSIPPEEVGNIFKRFYRIRNRKTTSSNGAGLGLSLAQEIAKKYNGEIRVSSNPETGTNFVVTLPLYQEIMADE